MRQSVKWRKIFAYYTPVKGLIYRIHMGFKHINSTKTDRQFSKEDAQMLNRYMKKYSVTLIIKYMQITIIMRYHISPMRASCIKKTKHTKCRWKCEGREALAFCWRGVPQCSCYREQYGDLSELTQQTHNIILESQCGGILK